LESGGEVGEKEWEEGEREREREGEEVDDEVQFEEEAQMRTPGAHDLLGISYQSEGRGDEEEEEGAVVRSVIITCLVFHS
jgi:hypothetical protein